MCVVCCQVLRGGLNVNYAPHFGTSAALQALEPLRGSLAGRGVAFDGLSGYSWDSASLQRAAVAALQGSVQAIEVMLHAALFSGCIGTCDSVIVAVWT